MKRLPSNLKQAKESSNLGKSFNDVDKNSLTASAPNIIRGGYVESVLRNVEIKARQITRTELEDRLRKAHLRRKKDEPGIEC